jgi:hypothetical protein
MPKQATASRWTIVLLALWESQMLAAGQLPAPLAPVAPIAPALDTPSATHTNPSSRESTASANVRALGTHPPTSTGQLPPEPTPTQHSAPLLLGPPVAPLPTTSDLPSTADYQQRPSQQPHITNSPADTLPPVTRTAALGAPQASADPIPAHTLERNERLVPPLPSADPLQQFLQQRSDLKPTPRSPTTDRDTPTSTTTHFGERLTDILQQALGHHQDLFKSDHVFDNFISPMTQPFLFEDPRSVTEVRPIFLFQKVPSRQPDFRGGTLWFFGGQARVALTDRISLVIHKLGGLSIDTGSGSIYNGSTGFSEFWLGPKYTFWRDDQSGSVAAAGLQFQIPIGTRSIYQDTGTLSLTPYVSYAQNWDFGWRLGSLNSLIGTGYSLSVTAHRSDYYYLSAQLDLDTFNNHRFYPLTGLNWQIYTANGKERPFFGSEGRDLFNVGGLSRGRGLLTWAIGARYKISEAAQLGGAFELPLAGPRDFFSYRFSIDFILRY